jgi:hypothetical protein
MQQESSSKNGETSSPLSKNDLSKAIDKLSKTQEPLEASVGDPENPDIAVIARLSREMLQIFLDSPPGQGPNYNKWARQGIQEATEARGHVVEPVSAFIVGSLLVGLVLAARIKKIGKDGVEFYPGLPNLSKLIAAASSMAMPFG